MTNYEKLVNALLTYNYGLQADKIANHILKKVQLMPDINVGDNVYTIDRHIIEHKVFKLVIEQNELEKHVTFFTKSIPTNYRPYVTYGSYDLSKIGNKVYLTYDDAKFALSGNK